MGKIMGKLPITIAVSDYDHTRDFAMGRVEAAGLDVNYLDLGTEEIFHRFVHGREWEVSEMSFAKFASEMCSDEPDIVGLPVFPSRVFRLSSIYLRRDKMLSGPEELRAKKVGIPEWAQTAGVYARGWLQHDVGIPLNEIDWRQAGMNEPGRAEKVELNLPEGVSVTPVPDKSLDRMLRDGELDAVMAARPPLSVEVRHDPDIVRLIPDFQAAEEAYYRRTKIFPIMHVIVIRKDVVDENRWVMGNLYGAFEEARQRSLARLFDISASRFLIPWAGDYAAKMQALLGEDYFPYGLEPNRRTLEMVLLWAYEQGIASKHLKTEDLFPEEVRTRFKV